MNAAELSTRLKGLLSIRAVLERAGVSVSGFYSSTSRESPVPSANRAKIQQALLDTAAALEAIALELDTGGDDRVERERNTRRGVVQLAAKHVEEHGVRTRLEMCRVLTSAEERVLRRAFRATFDRPWSDDADMVSGILSMNRRLKEIMDDHETADQRADDDG